MGLLVAQVVEPCSQLFQSQPNESYPLSTLSVGYGRSNFYNIDYRWDLNSQILDHDTSALLLCYNHFPSMTVYVCVEDKVLVIGANSVIPAGEIVPVWSSSEKAKIGFLSFTNRDYCYAIL